jgi:alkanesulfonate monooxygenase SsuD/methylene tetrahydromethanopterin reductase-like flavin-dependent oxidoreductase (luciferase family)
LVCLEVDGRVPPGVEEAVRYMFATYASWTGGSSDQGGGSDLAAILKETPVDQLVLAGDPASVAERLEPLAAAYAGEREHHLMVRLHMPGMSREDAEQQLRSFAHEVMPRLRESGARASSLATQSSR